MTGVSTTLCCADVRCEYIFARLGPFKKLGRWDVLDSLRFCSTAPRGSGASKKIPLLNLVPFPIDWVMRTRFRRKCVRFNTTKHKAYRQSEEHNKRQ